MSTPAYAQGQNWQDQDPPRRLAAFESTYDYRYKRCLVGIEEHCAVPPDFKDAPSTAHFASLYKFGEEFMKDVGNRLTNVELRVKTMDKCGVAAQLLSLAEPGTQGFNTDELEKSISFAQRANDWMVRLFAPLKSVSLMQRTERDLLQEVPQALLRSRRGPDARRSGCR